MNTRKLLIVTAIAALAAICAPAFAANPFMDVPMKSWAYDAVEALHSRGIVSGYPDGSYKGSKPITRYEMASIIARALAWADDHHASREDLEILKKLVVEFKDELDALGVKVDGFDKKLAGLDGVRGWKFWGEIVFDANWRNRSEDNGYNYNHIRLWMNKQVNENISFTARIRNRENETTGRIMEWDQMYGTVKNFLGGTTLRFGRWVTDWEGDDSLYEPDYGDADQTDIILNGFEITKDFDKGKFIAYSAKGTHTAYDYGSTVDTDEVGTRLRFDFNERFWLSLNGIWRNYRASDASVDTYWAALGFKFTPVVELKGMYARQKVAFGDQDAAGTDYEDTPGAYKIILDMGQDALKFTNLWIQYSKYDKGYVNNVQNCGYNFNADNNNDYALIPAFDENAARGLDHDVKLLMVRAQQQWNDRWATFERFLLAKDGVGSGDDTDDVKNWTIGMKWFFDPGLTFELAYDAVDYGDVLYRGYDKDHVIRLRTTLQF